MDLIGTTVHKLKNINTPTVELEKELQAQKEELRRLQEKFNSYKEIIGV